MKTEKHSREFRNIKRHVGWNKNIDVLLVQFELWPENPRAIQPE